MRKVYLLKYNNYANRIIKKEADIGQSITNYLPYVYSIQLQTEIDTGYVDDIPKQVLKTPLQYSSYFEYNFVYGNGITTQIELLLPTQEVSAINADNIDYLIVTDSNSIIESRWFIVGNNIVSGGKRKLALKRDVIVDNWSSVLSADVQIERAKLDKTDPLIFNPEGHQFNQIKTSETLLKQKYNCAWYVAYLKKGRLRDVEGGKVSDTHTITAQIPEKPLSGTYATWSDFPFYEHIKSSSTTQKTYEVDRMIDFNILFNGTTKAEPYLHYYCAVNDIQNQEGNVILSDGTNIYGFNGNIYDESNQKWYWKRSTQNATLSRTYLINGDWTELKDYYKDDVIYFNPDLYFCSEDWEDAINLNATRINVNGEVWDLSVEEVPYDLTHQTVGDNNYEYQNVYVQQQSDLNGLTTTKSTIASMFTSGKIFYEDPTSVDDWTLTNANSSMYGQLRRKRYIITATKRISLSSQVSGYIRGNKGTVSTTQDHSYYGQTTLDTEYDIIAVPYGDNLKYKFGNNGTVYNIDKDTCLAFINAITLDLGTAETSGWVYDIQKVPYIPNDLIYDSATQTFILREDEAEPSPSHDKLIFAEHIKRGIVNCGFVTYLEKANFKSRINLSTPISYDSLTNTEFKIENETSFFRLCSPNYSASFEFSGTKNGGINYFDVSCTLKPYAPYIQINPNWGGLYGQSFEKDNRGLICKGDFSITQLTSDWRTYQLQNKNYEEIFNRTIESMEYNREQTKELNTLAAWTGSISGASSGAISGSILTKGSATGGLIGAVVGGAASLRAGLADAEIQDNLAKERISATKDINKLTLGNIQARPNTMTKLSTADINNKVFPVLEYYTCTAGERNALQYYLKYNSFNVGTVGEISEYLENEWTFIKGKVLRMGTATPEFKNDYSTYIEINNELSLGVYMKIIEE